MQPWSSAWASLCSGVNIVNQESQGKCPPRVPGNPLQQGMNPNAAPSNWNVKPFVSYNKINVMFSNKGHPLLHQSVSSQVELTNRKIQGQGSGRAEVSEAASAPRLGAVHWRWLEAGTRGPELWSWTPVGRWSCTTQRQGLPCYRNPPARWPSRWHSSQTPQRPGHNTPSPPPPAWPKSPFCLDSGSRLQCSPCFWLTPR